MKLHLREAGSATQILGVHAAIVSADVAVRPAKAGAALEAGSAAQHRTSACRLRVEMMSGGAGARSICVGDSASAINMKETCTGRPTHAKPELPDFFDPRFGVA